MTPPATHTVGVLAIQGDWAAHARAVSALGHEPVLVKAVEHLADVTALLLPGGESSTMLHFLLSEELLEPLATFCRSGRPVFGTCAGAILLASEVTGPEQQSLGVLDMSVERNAYGRQRESFITRLADPGGELDELEAVFIRAPVIRRIGAGLDVVLRHGDDPVLVRSGPVWAATFHPEMTADSRVLARVLSA